MSADELDIKWKPFTLTLVEYPEGDIFGLLFALSSLLPVFVVCSFVTLIVFRREMHTLAYFVGLLGSEAINISIKHFVKEPRPASRHLTVGVKYGWPSSHSQFTWFLVVYLNLFIHIRCHSTRSVLYDSWKYVVSLLSTLVGVSVAYGRVYLQYHTENQVVWGSCIGAALAIVWFLTTHFLLTPLFPLVVHSKLGEFFMIRDSTFIPNVLWFEYSVSRQESRRCSRKMSMSKSQ